MSEQLGALKRVGLPLLFGGVVAGATFIGLEHKYGSDQIDHQVTATEAHSKLAEGYSVGDFAIGAGAAGALATAGAALLINRQPTKRRRYIFSGQSVTEQE